ncbi:hypothetical protein O1611_g4528 [Lasiodiplodia mahajangana]|uniref:Uncharacterized protein n=1 Tax=Lasiodiplodia mahajangana TaxID=1108764 RepID=A0ACC2JP36_9PEZI|nr:hypothetical protein O1611_g4528 [Lasiodiplodia mahajangana]
MVSHDSVPEPVYTYRSPLHELGRYHRLASPYPAVPIHVEHIHATLVLRVEVGGLAGAADDVGVALVGDEADLAIDLALRELYSVLDELTLGDEAHVLFTVRGVQIVNPDQDDLESSDISNVDDDHGYGDDLYFTICDDDSQHLSGQCIDCLTLNAVRDDMVDDEIFQQSQPMIKRYLNLTLHLYHLEDLPPWRYGPAQDGYEAYQDDQKETASIFQKSPLAGNSEKNEGCETDGSALTAATISKELFEWPLDDVQYKSLSSTPSRVLNPELKTPTLPGEQKEIPLARVGLTQSSSTPNIDPTNLDKHYEKLPPPGHYGDAGYQATTQATLHRSKFQSRQFQSLDIPRLCNTITVYIDRGKTANTGSNTAKGSSGSPTAMEPVKFALSRSRRTVNDTDLVATISLKRQPNNSWLQCHLPLQPTPFRKIVIGPIGNKIIVMKDESASAKDKPE